MKVVKGEHLSRDIFPKYRICLLYQSKSSMTKLLPYMRQQYEENVTWLRRCGLVSEMLRH
jgi:hypothetical protein